MSLRLFTNPLPDAPLDALEVAWERSDAMFGWLDRALAGGSLGEWTRQALLARPIPLRHPFIFYLGHLPAFAWNQVGRGVLGRGPFDERVAHFDTLFERGIDPLDAGSAPAVAEATWPDVVAVLSYRYGVRSDLLELAAELPAAAGDPLATEASPGVGARVLHLVLEHELMHHETLLYMIQAHELASLRAEPALYEVDTTLPPEDSRPETVAVPAGAATLGADFEEAAFGWDNEFPRVEVEVPAFRLDRRPVTNGDWRRFIAAGGYEDSRLWEPGDLEWLVAQGRRSPWNWHRRQGSHWAVRAPFVEASLDEAAGWPVQVSHAEASAYARWRGGRLPTESELHRAAYGDDDRPYPWGSGRPSARHGAFGWLAVGPVPIGSRPAGRSALGVDELVGNGWEWTSTPFGPLPGFEPWMRTYPGYSADFFDGQHFVVFGASLATDPRLIRRSFRNWYQRRYPWAFTKFRLAWQA